MKSSNISPSDCEKFFNSCKSVLYNFMETQNCIPGDMRYYHSIAICAFDAVFSISSRYSTVQNTLSRLYNLIDFNRLVRIPSDDNQYFLLNSMPDIKDQVPCSTITDILKRYSPEQLASPEYLSNRQRTSTRNGILKTEAFLRYLEIFKNYQIETYQDLERRGRGELEEELMNIPGQRNVAVTYFYMLAGDENNVKVDRHIQRFVNNSLGREIEREARNANEYIRKLFICAAKQLRKDRICQRYGKMTARHLDHIIWQWQRSSARR